MTNRTIIKAMVIVLTLPLFFSCSKDSVEGSNPIVEEQGITLAESEATRLSVKNLMESSQNISLADFVTEAKKLKNIKDAIIEDSLVYLTTTAGGSICVDLYGSSLRKQDYEEYSVDTCGTYIQKYIDAIEEQYKDSISDGVEYDPIEGDSIDVSYGDEEDVITTRATLHHRKILNKRRIAVWSPWPGFKEDDEILFSKIAERAHINYTIITNYSPSSFKTFGNYDLVFIGAHGSEDGAVFIPMDCSPYYENKYVFTENGEEKIDLASLTRDGLGYGLINHYGKTVEAMILNKRFFDANLSNLSNTIICTSICYGGHRNSQLLQSALNKGCPEFYGGDKPVTGVGPISFFMYYLPMFAEGASAKKAFEIGKANMIKGNYNYNRYGNTNVTYFNPYITGVREVKDKSAILGVKFQFSLDIPGSVNSETANQYGIYLENLGKYIPLSNSNVINQATTTLYNSVCAYYANVKIDDLTPNTNYRYRSYVIVGNKVTFSDTAESFKTELLSHEESGQESYLSCPDDNHPHAINLGLPSGTKWACCNVGASKPEEPGGFYAWGETNEKAEYTMSNCQRYDYEHWNTDFHFNEIAGSQYDVAHVSWGQGWYLPSYKQCIELLKNCYFSDYDLNRNYKAAVGKNGGWIIFPIRKFRDDVHNTSPRDGYYWSSSRYYYSAREAYMIEIHPGTYQYADVYYDDIYKGMMARPVCN